MSIGAPMIQPADLSPDVEPEMSEDTEPEGIALGGEEPGGGEYSSPEDALAAAIEEHGADDPAKLVSWLQEYGFDLVKSEGGEPMGEELPDLEGEEPEEGDESLAPDGGNEEIGLDLKEHNFNPMEMRSSAAKRAFSKHYGEK
jgi:hypothetical protein